MVLEKLGNSLKNTLQKIAKAIFVDEKLVNELIKDLQRALLESDVNVKLVFELTNKIRQRITKEETPPSLTKKEFLINIVYEELTNFLGGEGAKININKKPFKILLVGLFGNGKTTQAAKLAYYYKKRGKKVALVQTDTWRPAAYTQLESLADSIQVNFFGDENEKNPTKIYKKYEDKLSKYDVVIIDSAGRDALSNELINELDAINKIIMPDETLLVMSADVGQAAQKQAEAFSEKCHITGVIITKLEGTAKGGGALSACAVTGAPVKFIGVGEKIDALEEFEPKRFVGRLLGWGDIQALIEKVQGAISEEEAKDLQKKFLKGEFTLIDLYQQMESMKKMGPLTKLLDLIPGMSQLQLPKELLEVQEEKLKKWKFILQSCTRKELEDPDIISGTRIERIAKGAGVSSSEVRDLLKQFRQSKKLLKMFKGKGLDSPKAMQKMMQQMKRFKGFK